MIGPDAIRGHIDLILLAILERRRSYAYELSRTITDEAGGDYVIKQTTLYTALKRMEGQGWLASAEALSDSGKPRTYYELTPAGREQLAAKREEWATTRTVVDHFVKGRDPS